MRPLHPNDFRLGLSLSVGGFIFVWGALRSFSRRRQVEDMPRARVDSAPQGWVELQGWAWARAGAVALTLEGRQAVYRSWELQVRTGSGRSSSWRRVFFSEHKPPFLLVDESGQVEVDAASPQWELRSHTRDLSSLPPQERQRLEEEMRRFGQNLPHVGFLSRPHRLVEKVLLLGSPVLAQGSFQSFLVKTGVNVLPGLESFLDRARRVGRDPAYAAAQLDSNGDGQLSDEEMARGLNWAAASSGSAALKQAPSQWVELKGRLQSAPERDALIADCDETRLVRRLRRSTLAMLPLGLALCGIGFYLIARAMR